MQDIGAGNTCGKFNQKVGKTDIIACLKYKATLLGFYYFYILS